MTEETQTHEDRLVAQSHASGLRRYMKQSFYEVLMQSGERTYHSAMIALTGVARPGKTARDRAKRVNRTRD